MFKRLSLGTKFVSKHILKNKSINLSNNDHDKDESMNEIESKLVSFVNIEKNGVNIENEDNTILSEKKDITFEELFMSKNNIIIHPWLIANLNRMSIFHPTLIQHKTIPLLLNCKDTLFCSPTGSGKTLTYLLPMLQNLKHSRTCLSCVIVLPTRELSSQVYKELCFLVEGSDINVTDIFTYYKYAVNSQFEKLKKYDIIVTTPKKLLQVTKYCVDCLKNIKWLILDEGDLLLDTTNQNEFCSQVSEIYNKCNNPDIIRIISTATLHENIEKWAISHLYHAYKVTIYQVNSNIDQKLQYVGDEKGRIYELSQFIKAGIKPPVLIFVNNHEQGLELSKKLKKLDIKATFFTSSIKMRSQSLKDFRLGKIHFLITTDVLSRGIDFKGVNVVINYHVPYSPSIYIHRIGRTGRCGHNGISITFFTDDDKILLKNLIPVFHKSNITIPDWLKTSITTSNNSDEFKPKNVSTRKRKGNFNKRLPSKSDHN